jgi:putative copper export protein
MEASLALILEAIFTCLAVLSTTFWMGGVIWEIWILPPGAPGQDLDLEVAADAAGRRFRRLAPYALGVMLVANVALAFSQSALMVGGPSGRFGLLWSIREILIILALVITLMAAGRDRVTPSDSPSESSHISAASLDQAGRSIPDFGQEVARLLARLSRLPHCLVAGFRRQDRYQQVLCVLGLLLLITFVLPERGVLLSWESGYTVATSLLLWLCEAVWLGGLLYIGYILLPATTGMKPRQRARLMALGLPQFGAIAIIGGAVLVVTGYLNSTLQLIPWTELLTTTYGRTLAVMFELLLILAGMSAYHALFLRPRLAKELNAEDLPASPSSTREQLITPSQTLVGASPRLYVTPVERADDSRPPDRQPGQPEPPVLSPRARSLEERLRDWLRREALLAGALLLCVVLLGIFAVSLLPNLTTAGVSGQSKGPYIGTQTTGSYTVTMRVSPDIFGTNTFTVTLKDASGRPVDGAHVLIETDSLDMDMGIQTIHLREIGAAAPGSYGGQSELTMAGHWKATVILQVPGSRQPLTLDFQFSAAY